MDAYHSNNNLYPTSLYQNDLYIKATIASVKNMYQKKQQSVSKVC